MFKRQLFMIIFFSLIASTIAGANKRKEKKSSSTVCPPEGYSPQPNFDKNKLESTYYVQSMTSNIFFPSEPFDCSKMSFSQLQNPQFKINFFSRADGSHGKPQVEERPYYAINDKDNKSGSGAISIGLTPGEPANANVPFPFWVMASHEVNGKYSWLAVTAGLPVHETSRGYCACSGATIQKYIDDSRGGVWLMTSDPEVDPSVINKMRSELSNKKVDLSALNTVNHKNCTYNIEEYVVDKNYNPNSNNGISHHQQTITATTQLVDSTSSPSAIKKRSRTNRNSSKTGETLSRRRMFKRQETDSSSDNNNKRSESSGANTSSLPLQENQPQPIPNSEEAQTLSPDSVPNDLQTHSSPADSTQPQQPATDVSTVAPVSAPPQHQPQEASNNTTTQSQPEQPAEVVHTTHYPRANDPQSNNSGQTPNYHEGQPISSASSVSHSYSSSATALESQPPQQQPPFGDGTSVTPPEDQSPESANVATTPEQPQPDASDNADNHNNEHQTHSSNTREVSTPQHVATNGDNPQTSYPRHFSHTATENKVNTTTSANNPTAVFSHPPAVPVTNASSEHAQAPNGFAPDTFPNTTETSAPPQTESSTTEAETRIVPGRERSAVPFNIDPDADPDIFGFHTIGSRLTRRQLSNDAHDASETSNPAPIVPFNNHPDGEPDIFFTGSGQSGMRKRSLYKSTIRRRPHHHDQPQNGVFKRQNSNTDSVSNNNGNIEVPVSADADPSIFFV